VDTVQPAEGTAPPRTDGTFGVDFGIWFITDDLPGSRTIVRVEKTSAKLASMGLKLLCAGCSKDERAQAEAAVRQALGRKAEDGAWTVSLVRITGRWSVTLDGPAFGVRALTLVAPEGRLREAIVEALQKPAAPPTGQAGGAERRAPGQCEKCRGRFVVIYEARPEEAEESVAVACPHCWHVNHVLVGETAAEARDYRAEKA